MNSLTIIIYLIEVIDNLNTATHVVSMLSIIMGVAFGIAYLISAGADPNCRYDKNGVVVHQITGKWAPRLFALAAVCTVLGVFTPSRETMYMMAGSEVTEVVVNTPEAQAIIQDIQEVLRSQLKALKADGVK